MLTFKDPNTKWAHMRKSVVSPLPPMLQDDLVSGGRGGTAET